MGLSGRSGIFALELVPAFGDTSAMEVSPRPQVPPRRTQAFTSLDLLGALLAACLVLGVVLPSVAGIRPANGQAQCTSNFRRLMLASQLYARDNADYLPHPTWGGDLTGPDGWAYATVNNGRIPGGPRTPRALFRDSQLPFREIGQLWNYVKSGSAYECPDDLINTQPNSIQFRDRAVKITSYNFSGMITGVPYPQALTGDLTYKLSRFLPTDILAIEPSESIAFNFNDAGFNPDDTTFSITGRHGGFPSPTGTSPSDTSQETGGIVGCVDGRAEFFSQARYASERSGGSAGERTRIRCYPWR